MGFTNSLNNVSLNTPIISVGTNYTAGQYDYIIEINDTSSVRTVTLPAPSLTGATANKGKVFVIKDGSGGAATNNIIISPASGLIDGSASSTITSNYGSITTFCDGTNYFTVANVLSIGNVTPTLNIQRFTASGTYTPSANLQYAIVEMVGGGGGSGGVSAGAVNHFAAGGGGGGGGFVRAVLTASQIGASQSITIGSGGTAGASGGAAPGGDGANSTFGSLLTAGGGIGGDGAATGGFNCSAAQGGSGGSFTISTGQNAGSFEGYSGGNGFGASNGSSGTGGALSAGAGGNTPLGAGAKGFAGRINTSSPLNAAGTAGTANTGGGASGACSGGTSGTAQSGAVGGSGLCVVIEYIFAPPPLTTTASIIWNTVSGTSQTMVASNGYYTTNASATTLTLPTTAAAGTMMAVLGTGTGLWTIAQNAGQTIQYGAQVTTTGTGGSLVASAQGNEVWLVCTTANTVWFVTSSIGNITVN